MIALAVVLLISAVVMIVLGLILYGNGVGAVPDDVGRDPVAARRGVTRISWSELFARMRTSTRGMTDKEAGREQKLTALGSFLVMVGHRARFGCVGRHCRLSLIAESPPPGSPGAIMALGRVDQKEPCDEEAGSSTYWWPAAAAVAPIAIAPVAHADICAGAAWTPCRRGRLHEYRR